MVEDGTHDALIKTGGRYASLHRLQAGIHEVHLSSPSAAAGCCRPTTSCAPGRQARARSWPSCRPRSRSSKRRRRRSAARSAFTLILLFCAALAWSWWGSIDIVASATGKIVPSIRTKVIQPFETGVVRAIRVQDGQVVKAGDVLIELDPTANAADRDHLRSDLLAEQLNVARLARGAGRRSRSRWPSSRRPPTPTARWSPCSASSW